MARKKKEAKEPEAKANEGFMESLASHFPNLEGSDTLDDEYLEWRSDIKVCTDVFIPDEDLKYFADLAFQEDPTNGIPGLRQAFKPGSIFPVSIAFVTGKKWTNGRTLSVAFMGGTSAQQEFVAKIASQWSEFANINFQWGVAVANSDLRISFDKSGGAYSYVGSDNIGIPKNRATMNLGWLDEAVVLHEFGHALAAIHEHQHPQAGIPWNKDAVYRYYAGPPNYWSKAMVDNNLFAQYSISQTQFSVYDPRSIMHYAIPAQLLIDPTKAVGWNNVLSQADKQFISTVYPKSTKPPPPPPTGKVVEIPETGTYKVVEINGSKQVVFNP